ncbi:hypothetical protein OC835_007623, partial [Tilletia horrida]
MVNFPRPSPDQVTSLSALASWRHPIWDVAQQPHLAHQHVNDWTIAGRGPDGRPRQLTEDELEGLFTFQERQLPKLKPMCTIEDGNRYLICCLHSQGQEVHTSSHFRTLWRHLGSANHGHCLGLVRKPSRWPWAV